MHKPHSRCANISVMEQITSTGTAHDDSTMGCDDDHDYQPPCRNNIVDASKAVWKGLGVPKDNWGELDISWSDAQLVVFILFWFYYCG